MKIFIIRIYCKQCLAPSRLLCLPKIILAHVRVEVDQTSDPLDVLVNLSQSNEVLKVHHNDIGWNFVHKHGRANQEQQVTPQCTLPVLLNLDIITYDIQGLLANDLYKAFQ